MCISMHTYVSKLHVFLVVDGWDSDLSLSLVVVVVNVVRQKAQF